MILGEWKNIGKVFSTEFFLLCPYCVLFWRAWNYQRNMVKLTDIVEGPDEMVVKNILYKEPPLFCGFLQLCSTDPVHTFVNPGLRFCHMDPMKVEVSEVLVRVL